MATDFQNLANGLGAATSVMSVQVLEDGSCGEVRIVAGNQAYIDSIEHPAGDYSMRTNKFEPGRLYTDYVPRDLNFEDFLFPVCRRREMPSFLREAGQNAHLV